MAQKSYPWPGVAPASGADAGRYTAPEWWGVWLTMQEAGGVIKSAPLLRTPIGFAGEGVFYSVVNRLAVTSPAANQIAVNTGAWLCDGQFGYNDTAFTGAITSPVANPRIDRVVVRKNFTGNTYNPPNAGPAFDVPPYTARITIIHGAEAPAPVAPHPVWDTARNPAGVFGVDGTWDIPLARYQISVAGAITGPTDEREWVDAEIKTFAVPYIYGRYDEPPAGDLILGSVDGINYTSWGLGFPEGWAQDDAHAAVFRVPFDYISGFSVVPIIVVPAGAAGNIWVRNAVWSAACGAEKAALAVGPLAVTIATVNEIVQCLTEIVVAPAVSAGDICYSLFSRYPAAGGDTSTDDIFASGLYVEYLGWR